MAVSLVVYVNLTDNSSNRKTATMPLLNHHLGGIAMVLTLFFHELGLVALVRVFLMLYWLWPNDSAARHQPSALSTAEDE